MMKDKHSSLVTSWDEYDLPTPKPAPRTITPRKFSSVNSLNILPPTSCMKRPICEVQREILEQGGNIMRSQLKLNRILP